MDKRAVIIGAGSELVSTNRDGTVIVYDNQKLYKAVKPSAKVAPGSLPHAPETINFVWDGEMTKWDNGPEVRVYYQEPWVAPEFDENDEDSDDMWNPGEWNPTRMFLDDPDTDHMIDRAKLLFWFTETLTNTKARSIKHGPPRYPVSS